MTLLRHTRSPRAFTLLEVIIVAGLMGAVLGIAAQMLASVRRQAQLAEHQVIAMRTLENCLEEFTSRPWDQLETSQITTALLPEPIRTQWPKAKLVGEVKTTAEPLIAKQITMALTLSPAPRARSVQLTTWTYRTPNK